MEYLGSSFDIHGGGADLTFPHHENEIAQSEASTGRSFANYWIHNGFVNIRSEKMSKSLGNVLNIRDILEKVHPEALRLFLLSSHYRSPLDYNEASIREASVGLERLYSALTTNLTKLIEAEGTSTELPEELQGITGRFVEAMDDDFNTPRCLAILFDAARAVNRIFTEAGASRELIPSPVGLSEVRCETVGLASDVLGLLTQIPEKFQESVYRLSAYRLAITEEEIEKMVAERAEARKRRDFTRADEIRADLAAKGVVLEDGPKGTAWKIKDSL